MAMNLVDGDNWDEEIDSLELDPFLAGLGISNEAKDPISDLPVVTFPKG